MEDPMKLWLVWLYLLVLALILAACAAPAATAQPTLTTPKAPASTAAPAGQPDPSPTMVPSMNSRYPDLGPAPELAGDIWLNTEAPLRLDGLRGKVVLVDMWTFG
jgi:hypothetical protein